MRAKGSKNHVPLPDEMKEYLAIYTTEYDDSYILEPIVASDLEMYRSSIENQKERIVEASIDYDGYIQRLLFVKVPGTFTTRVVMDEVVIKEWGMGQEEFY